MTAQIIHLPIREATVEMLRTDFLAGLTTATSRVYRWYLNRLSSFIAPRRPETVTRRELGAWTRSMQDEGLLGATVTVALAALLSFLSFAMYEGVVDRNVAKAVRFHVEKVESPRRPLSPEEVQRMFTAYNADLCGLRDRAIHLLASAFVPVAERQN
jgi:site-specific recombinase XerD